MESQHQIIKALQHTQIRKTPRKTQGRPYYKEDKVTEKKDTGSDMVIG
jgi:hypothetical protein